MRKLAGWAALVGGGLSGATLALFLLAPMFGFYPLGSRDPGPRISGAVELPSALAARTGSALGPIRGLTLRSTGGSPVVAVPTVARGTLTLRPSTATRTSGASTPGNGSRRGASGTPVPTSAPVVGPGAPTPMVVVTPPVSQPQVSEPVAQPVTPVVAVPQQPTATPVAKTGSSPSVAGSSNGEGSRHDDGVTASPVADEHAAAKAARQEAKAVREEAKAARKADKHGHAPAAVVTQPVQDTATTVTDTTTTSDDAESGATDGEQGTGHRHGNGGGHNHDGGDGHGSHGRWSGEESDG